MIKQYVKKDGSKWWFFKTYLGVDPLTGKKKFTTRRGFKTKKAASTALSQLQLSIEKNGLPGASTDVTFKEAAEMWLVNYKNTVEASTFSRTSLLFEKHIYPKFGDLLISKITTSYCQKVANFWSEKGTSKQFPLFLNYMSKVFKYAINLELTDKNPVVNVIVPTNNLETGRKEKELKMYTKEQLDTYLKEVNKETNSYFKIRDYTIFRLLAFSGCRIGEVLALTWDDIDFETKKIRINKTVTKAKKYYISKTPKTSKSNRKLFLDDKTILTLKKWKLAQSKFLFELGFSKPAHIFTNEDNKFTINQAVTERLVVYTNRAKLPYIGLHGFRHTHASLLYSAGADHKEVQERLGHANIKTTMDTYTHLTDDKKEETIEKLVKYINF